MVNVTGLTPVVFMKDNRRRYSKKNLTRKTSLQCFPIFRNLCVYLLLDFPHWNATILSASHLYVYKISTMADSQWAVPGALVLAGSPGRGGRGGGCVSSVRERYRHSVVSGPVLPLNPRLTRGQILHPAAGFFDSWKTVGTDVAVFKP